jgi:hypothetical protein
MSAITLGRSLADNPWRAWTAVRPIGPLIGQGPTRPLGESGEINKFTGEIQINK